MANEPETIVGDWDEDRNFRPALPSGNFVSLLLIREEGVFSDLYAQFDLSEFSDTAVVVGAELDLTMLGGTDAGVRIEAFLIDDAAGEWTEGDVPLEGLPLAAEPFFEGTSVLIPREDGDPLSVLGAVQIPADIVHSWQTDPDLNRGIALRVASSNTGYLDLASSEAVLDTTSQSISPAGLRLLVSEGQGPSTIRAANDAYRLFDSREVDSPTAPTLFVEQQIPHRGLIRVDVEDLLIPAGSTIHRAELVLGIVPGSIAVDDTFTVGSYRNTSDWMVESEPDSVTVNPNPTAIVTLTSVSESAEFDFGSVMQQWIDGADNFGLTLRILGEGSEDGAVRFHSVEADSSGPIFRIEYVPPPSPRWEDDPR